MHSPITIPYQSPYSCHPDTAFSRMPNLVTISCRQSAYPYPYLYLHAYSMRIRIPACISVRMRIHIPMPILVPISVPIPIPTSPPCLCPKPSAFIPPWLGCPSDPSPNPIPISLHHTLTQVAPGACHRSFDRRTDQLPQGSITWAPSSM